MKAGRELQEREETSRAVALVKHTSDDHYIVNFDGLHNAHLLRRLFPSNLYRGDPLFQDRKQHHREMAKKLRETNTEKRELASSKRALTTGLKNAKKGGAVKAKTRTTRQPGSDTPTQPLVSLQTTMDPEPSIGGPLVAVQHPLTQPQATTVSPAISSTGNPANVSSWQSLRNSATTQPVPPHHPVTPGPQQYSPQLLPYPPYRHQVYSPHYGYGTIPYHAYYPPMGNAHAAGSTVQPQTQAQVQNQGFSDAVSDTGTAMQSDVSSIGHRSALRGERDTSEMRGPSKKQRLMDSLFDT